MKTSSISSNSYIYNLYNAMYQGNLALSGIKMNGIVYPANKTQSANQLGAGALQYVNNIKLASKNLKSAINNLSGAAFAKKGVVSSDTSLLSVKYTGNDLSAVKPISVKIDQTAAGQLNEGAKLNASAAYAGSGVNKFSISINGKTTEFSVSVAAGDTNSVVQKKMADAVNNAGIGVKATVETDSTKGLSTLKLEAVSTGNNDKSKFTVNDILGDLTARVGVNNVTREARDAVYSVNGGATQTSATNNIDLGNGVSATLNASSEKTVTVQAGRDFDYVISVLDNMVKSYNDLYVEAAQNTNDPKAQNLATKMVNVSKTYFGSLSNIGIGFDSSGRMTLDTARLNSAAENGSLEKFFTENSGKNYGFTNQLARLADNVSLNTANYVSSSLIGSALTENYAYTSFAELIQYNYLSAGLLFDYSF